MLDSLEKLELLPKDSGNPSRLYFPDTGPSGIGLKVHVAHYEYAIFHKEVAGWDTPPLVHGWASFVLWCWPTDHPVVSQLKYSQAIVEL